MNIQETNTDGGGRRFKGPWQKRQERRVEEARALESSNAAAALKAELSHHGKNALVTVTQPETHQFARIRAQALFGNLGPSVDVYTSDRFGERFSTTRSYKLVELTLPKSRKGNPDGIVVRSANGQEAIPHDASSKQTTEAVRRAVKTL